MTTRSQGLTSVLGATVCRPVLLQPDPSAAPHAGGQGTGTAEEARGLLALGLRPFPVDPITKKPLVAWGSLQDTPPTEEEVARAFAAHPGAAIGLVTGHPGGLDVLDLDVDASGRLPSWPNPPDLELPVGLVIRTPRGGLHYAFRHTSGVRNTTGKLAPCVDVRGTGGFFVAVGPGRETLAGSFAEALRTEAPEWLRKALLSGNGARPHAQPGASIDDGARNATLASLAGSMRRRGMSQQAITAALHAENEARCHPPLPEAEVCAIAESIGRYPPAEPDSRCATPDSDCLAAIDTPHLTDMGNARRFSMALSSSVRYCHPQRKWLAWNGSHWVIDREGLVGRHATDVVRGLYQEASRPTDSQARKDLAKWAEKSESQHRISAMLELAKCEEGIAVLPEDLDTHPWLLNTPNGTLDLQTDRLRQHEPSDLITKVTGADLALDAGCPRWHQFLDEIMRGDQGLISFLQRSIGYALTGSTQEQCLFILYGSGSNGKSTLIEVVREMLGGYAMNSDPETFMVQRSGGPRPDIARLAGARLLTAQETEANQRLAESLVKQVTGGDTVTARFLYGHEFEFRPQFKLFLATNHRPVIRGTDNAIWRRVFLFPFEAKFPPEKQDKGLLGKLFEELPGVLGWAVEGCRLWREQGLNPPARVKAATEEYRKDMDVVGRFLAERCVESPTAEVKASDLYVEFRRWCDEVGEKCVTQNALGVTLGERGFESARTRRFRFWRGIELQREGDTVTLVTQLPGNPSHEGQQGGLPAQSCHTRHAGSSQADEAAYGSMEDADWQDVTQQLRRGDAVMEARVANLRSRTHARHASRRPLSLDYDLVGVAGEMAFARQFGLTIDQGVHPAGDRGVDFMTSVGTVDVKTYRRPLNLLREVGKPHAEILVLAGYDDTTGEADLIGWEWDYELVRCPTRDFGHGIVSHYKPASALQPISDLHRTASEVMPPVPF